MKKLLTVVLMVTVANCFITAQNSVKDADGNLYRTVKIGKQEWMAGNLKTTRYNNGDIIGTTVPANKNINGDKKLDYQWVYDGKEENAGIYGRLYTWHAATDERGLCPRGWHLPSNDEWTALAASLGGVSLAGGKLKETGTSHWLTPNVGASGEAGFSAVPGGGRLSDGTFNDFGTGAIWWSDTGDGYYLNYSDGYLHRYFFVKSSGFSVRCIKDTR